MKRILALLIVAAMCFGLITVSHAAEMNFTDVKESDWFYADVKTAVEMGLVNGKTATTYAPNDNLTYAEAIKLAACMNQLYNDGIISITGGNPWYQPYVDYCMENNIIQKEYNYSEISKRYGFMEIFAKALPDEALKEINTVPDGSIPDVSSEDSFSDAVYKLYRAGILSGVDESRKCNPMENIKRSEVAAIINRMMNEEKRVRFDMNKAQDAEAEEIDLTIASQTIDVFVTAGQPAELNVMVIGGKEPYSYQWTNGETELKDNEKVKGANTNNLEFIGDTPGITYSIGCKITDAQGTVVYSKKVEVCFNEAGNAQSNPETTKPLTIKEQPQDMAVEAGKTAFLKVVVEGGKPPYKYQWRTVSLINGETAYMPLTSDANKTTEDPTSIFYANPSASARFTMSCLVTDAEGSQIRANSAVLTFGTPPEASKPFEANIEAVSKSYDEKTFKTDAVLKVTIDGGKAPYTYKWEFSEPVGRGKSFQWETVPNGTSKGGQQSFSGATAEEITIATYTNYIVFRCVVTDADGKVATSSHIYAGPAISGITASSQESDALNENSDITASSQESNALKAKYGGGGITSDGWLSMKLEVTGGTAPYTYQWQGIYTRKGSEYSDWQSFTFIAESIKSIAEDILGEFGGLFTSADDVRARIRKSEKTDNAWYPVKNVPDDYADKAAIRCIVTDAEGQTIVSEPLYLEPHITHYHKKRNN